MKKHTGLMLAAVLLAGCSGLSIKGGSSLTVDRSTPDRHNNIATADVMLSREYKGSEINLGLRHLSNVDIADPNAGVNGLVFELRTKLYEF